MVKTGGGIDYDGFLLLWQDRSYQDEEVYVSQPLGFVDPDHPKKVTPKTSHLNAMKRIFKYLKGKPNLGLWYPRDSSFNLEAYSNSDYTGANLDRKSTTGVTFLGSKINLMECNETNIVAYYTTEAEYVVLDKLLWTIMWIRIKCGTMVSIS
ncbi:hypothetical protein Tco_0270110 [Tanacetum coccineum]